MLKSVVHTITTEQTDFLECLKKLKFWSPVSYTKTLKSKNVSFRKRWRQLGFWPRKKDMNWHSWNKVLWRIFISTELVTWQKDEKPHDGFHTFCPSWRTLGPHIGETSYTPNKRVETSVGKPEDVRLSGRSRIRWDNIEIDVIEASNDVGWTHLAQT